MKRLFSTEEEFLQVLYGGNSSADDGAFRAASVVVGTRFKRFGFRLFRNGGTPLLERREGPLIEEIVLQQGDDPALLSSRLHLSHLGLREVRARYWTTPARAPLSLAGGNVGELDLPPGWAVWTADDALRLTDWLVQLALPWFEMFEDPNVVRQMLHERGVPLLSKINALEWILAEFGRREARNYYEQWSIEGTLATDPELQDRLRSMEVCFHLV